MCATFAPESELSGDFFMGADSIDEAVGDVSGRLGELEAAAESVLRENGCADSVRAELVRMHFDERTYDTDDGRLTMPAGEYRTLRLVIGSGRGHNWWCVMYPALCVPAALGGETAEELFDDGELDILLKPEKYRVRFAIWDKIHGSAHGEFVQCDENSPDGYFSLDKIKELSYNYMVNKVGR